MTDLIRNYEEGYRNGHAAAVNKIVDMVEKVEPSIGGRVIHLMVNGEQWQELTKNNLCSCAEGPKLGKRENWARPRCGRCHLFVKE